MRRTKQGHSQSKFFRILTIPLRFLSKARDLYVKGMTDFSDRMVLPTGEQSISSISRSFSVSSSRSNETDDYRELVRAASARCYGHRNELDMYMRQSSMLKGPKVMPRSCSVGMGKIDEDRPCDFEEDGCAKAEVLYPRSRSCAVAQRTIAAF